MSPIHVRQEIEIDIEIDKERDRKDLTFLV